MASVNTFEVVYLGSAVLSQQSSTGLGATQKPLLELYSHYRTSGTSRIQRKFLEVTPDGYTLSYKEDPDGKIVNESYPVAAMQYTDAVRLNIVKGTGKKFKAAFEPLDPETNMNVSKLYFSLDKKKHFLAKIVHPAIFVSVLRRAVGPRALDCHAFVCSTSETAIKLSRSTNYIIRQFQNEDDDDTTVFKYKPYESSQQQAARRELPLDQMNLQQEFFMEPVNDSFFVSDDHQKNLASSDIWRPATNMRDPVGVRGGVEMNVHGRSKSVDLVHEHYDSRLHRRSHTAVEGLQDKSDFRTGHDSRLWFNNVDNNETVEGSLMERPRPLNKPVAKVQPHQLGGVKVLPTPVDLIKKRRNSETDDYNGQGKQPVYRFERQEFRGSQASNSPPRRHSTHDSNWHYATKLPDFSSPVDHETAYDSPEFQNSAVKDMEIASALKNLRMGHEQNRYRGNDFESSLGYLP